MIRILQCWDDGVADDIRLCDLLRKHGAKASFNLNFGLHSEQRSAPWRYAEAKDVVRLGRSELRSVYHGFTIANHSLSHPWPTRIPVAEWRREVLDGRKQLQDHFGQSVDGFAYPFGDCNDAVADVVREAGHCYARTCANLTPCLPAEDPFRQAADCHHASPDFWDRYERAKAAGATAFYFWGHSYEFLTERDWLAFGEKLKRFNADSDAVWADLPEQFS